MAISIATDAAALSRSRFAISPAFEITATLRGRSRSVHPHVRRWHQRAVSRLDGATLDLLHALIPDDHPYTPDFLTPHPQGPRDNADDMVESILASPDDEVAVQLDFTFEDRPVHRHFACSFADEASYLRWRRPVPGPLAALVEAGERAVVVAAAEAMSRFFEAALQEDWEQTVAVLAADISHRAELSASRGLVAVLNDLGEDVTYDGSNLVMSRPFDVEVDWADDGVMLIPCTALTGPPLFAVERPQTPLIVYPARGTGVLRQPGATRPQVHELGALIGATREDILRLLDEPRTTWELSHLDGHAPATISYHLSLLRRAGFVRSRRASRGVLYERTALGSAALCGVVTESAPVPVTS